MSAYDQAQRTRRALRSLRALAKHAKRLKAQRDIGFVYIDELRRDLTAMYGRAIDANRALLRCQERIGDFTRERDAAIARAEKAERERDRLQKLFDDVGEGQYNVLALVDHYQREALDAARERDEMRARVGALLAAEGCDCDCDGPCCADDDREPCLACRIEAALKKEGT